MENVVVKLKKPVTANGEVTSEITLREPTGKEITECGMLFRVTGGEFDKSQTVDTKVAKNYIVALGNVTPQVVDGLSAPDWMALTTAVTGFFVDIPPATTS